MTIEKKLRELLNVNPSEEAEILCEIFRIFDGNIKAINRKLELTRERLTRTESE